jgi:hypothetical protein
MKLGITADRKPSLDAMWRAYRAAISGIEDESDWARVVTTTFNFDNNGNVIQKLTDGVLTTYQWDYANRLIALGVNNASTTLGCAGLLFGACA